MKGEGAGNRRQEIAAHNARRDYVNMVLGTSSEHEKLACECMLLGIGVHVLDSPLAKRLGLNRALVRLRRPWGAKYDIEQELAQIRAARIAGGQEEMIEKTLREEREFFELDNATDYAEIDVYLGVEDRYFLDYQFRLRIVGGGGNPGCYGQAILAAEERMIPE